MKNFLFTIFVFSSFICLGQFNCQQSKQHFKVAAATPPLNNNGKSDTLDILHYNLELDATNITSNTLEGICTITMVSKQNGVITVNLDLLTLSVTSVLYNQTTSCTYFYNGGPQLKVILPNAVMASDTFQLQINYGGAPTQDASGWGGFHFTNPYYFNLGVGFAANPHTYGRAWFPCFDNFVERSTYSFQVKTEGGRKAYCNGLRTSIDSVTFGGDTLVSHWEMTNEIPTYLASIAISNYAELIHTHNGMPFWIIARPSDTSNAKVRFSNLDAIYDGFVQRYGPYYWQKVGYALTTIGAMEHATSIHFPRNSLAAEDIIAHELAHHWFGNLITCETAGDMWINEGMAEYLSHQYEEDLNGRSAYMQVTKDNHTYVLNNVAVADSGYRALYGLPNELTYGTTTYQNGAVVGHNLRGYLGDSLFFNGITQLMANNKYKSISSAQFRDQLSAITGYNVTPFFEDWVFNPGLPDFNIDSMQVVSSAIPEKTVHVRVSQRMRATTKRFTHVPLTLSLHDAQGNKQDFSVAFLSADTTFTFLVPFHPTWAAINQGDHIYTGVAANDYVITSAGTIQDSRTKMRVATGAVTDSTFLRIEHHWAGPSTTGNENFKISTSRYWRVTGHIPASFNPTARLEFTSSPNNFYLDEDLLKNGEDSLILVYRKDATEEWREFTHYTKDYFGSPTNKYGRIELHTLPIGEYAFANGVSLFGVEEKNKTANHFKLFPNPTSQFITVDFGATSNNFSWQIVDAKGVEMLTGKQNNQQQTLRIDVATLATGTYFFCTDKGCQAFVKE